MIRRHAAWLRLSFAMLDSAGAVLAILAIGTLRFPDGSAFDSLRAAIPPWREAIGVFVLLWPLALWTQGLYRVRARLTKRREAIDIVRSLAIFAATILSLLFLFKLPDVSRGLLLPIFPAIAAFSFASRILLRQGLALMRARGRNTRFVLILGTTDRAQRFADIIESHPDLGLRAIGHVETNGEADPDLTRPIVGHLEQIEEILHANVVDEVALCLPVTQWQLIDELARLCEEEGKIVRIPMYVLEHTLAAGRVEEVDGLPIYSIITGPDRQVALAVKRVLDILVSGASLILLSPLFAAIALAIRLDSPGSIHFTQERVGLHGRRFWVVKFRTMTLDAEEQLGKLLALNEVRGPAFKITDDPRITRVGRWLRMTSLDELPQLWNVLRGEMSLVGPRPPLPAEVAGYDIWHRRRLSMKPGITGLWQVRHRRTADFDQWVETDLEYIDGWSFWLDLRIMLETIPAMVGRTGR
jgi:exopolysaccharide biosynthesis polyprenyl glycosylphosphotransferase